MNKVNQIVPISDMKLQQPEVLGMLAKGPVVLAHRSRPAAVLVSVEQWDRLMEQLEDQQDIIDVQEAELSLASSKSRLVEMSPEELEVWMADGATVPT